jgi:tellurite resistance protein TehA-like permease
LNPGGFSLVMATGIVSLACHLLDWPLAARTLLWLNVPAYLVLATLTLLRLARFPRRFFQDLIDHKRGVGFFTTVAASGVLGNQFLLIAEQRSVAVMLWCISVGLGFLITYTLFTGFAVKEKKPSLPEGIHGGWLLAVVAVQSISVLGTLLAHGFGDYAPQTLLYTLAMWLVGGMLYIWIISLIFYRYSFFPMTPDDLSPPYWINMGAMAISTLAGATLLSAAPDSELLRSIAPFIKGLTLLFWATATWWIPMLVILGVWRHGYMRYRLTYDPQYWGAVFPLGMYTVATFRLAHAVDQLYLLAVPRVFLYFALAAWCVVFVGLIRNLASRIRPRTSTMPRSG